MMNAIEKIKYKARIGLLLAMLLLLLILNNIVGQRSFTRMQHDTAAMYEDRLLASGYLFDIREQLFETQLTLLKSRTPGRETVARRQVQDSLLKVLMARYEATNLTEEEGREWQVFKNSLASAGSGEIVLPAETLQLQKAGQSLQKLMLIQVSEGAHLQDDLFALLSKTTLRAHMEVAVIILLGGITLSLIGFSRGAFEKTGSHPRLN